jgi:DNA polymerase-1
LVSQLTRLHELLSLLEVPVLYAPGYEADDVLATLARRLREEGAPALVVSGDRDLLQVAHGSVEVLFVGARGKPPTLYDEMGVERRFGVSPRQLPSWTALVGDPSDNLPKVPGVGPRTATRLVREYGDVSGILRHLTEILPPKLRPVLEGHAEQALLTERLATLVVDVPLATEQISLPISLPAFRRLRELFVELEFQSLIPRLDSLVLGAPL